MVSGQYLDLIFAIQIIYHIFESALFETWVTKLQSLPLESLLQENATNIDIHHPYYLHFSDSLEMNEQSKKEYVQSKCLIKQRDFESNKTKGLPATHTVNGVISGDDFEISQKSQKETCITIPSNFLNKELYTQFVKQVAKEMELG
ncbi:hypothetical protein H5410_056890 [Solanum commersonii]|uniref:Uncharacterized protein n=1 Tax=Solanum commersonii TaxID=4109 RepID=A0A9J5WNK2_SOLCO|nr:hypothetical protein H5410_056890 [Solanum commersonii]